MKEIFNIRYIVVIAFISALGGYLFGFDFAVITGGLPFLADQFSLDASGEGATTASLALGAVVGCILAGSIADRLGRKPGLLTAAFVFAISSLVMGFAPSLTVFISGRFFAGIGVGMASMLSPMYIAEISPEKYRGRLVALNQLTIVLGILFTHLINYKLKDFGPDSWRWMFGLGAIPSSIFFIGVLFLPESPRWLVLKGKKEQAAVMLRKIGGDEFVARTIKGIQSTSDAKKVPLKELFRKRFLSVVLLGIGIAVFQQWCGINVVFNYTAKLFESIGADRSEQLIQAVYIGIVNFVFTIIAMLLVDRIGRKPLMLVGAGGLALLYTSIVVVLKTETVSFLSPLILAAIGTYAISLAPVTWVLISEIFPNSIRSKALSVATVGLWLAYSVLVFTFPIITERTGEYVPFVIYTVICILGFFFILFKLKETKGKCLEDVEKDFIHS